MPKTKKTHHHYHIGAIGLLPIALIGVAAFWGSMLTGSARTQYQELAKRATQQVHLLDIQLRDMQRTHSALTNNEEVVAPSSIASRHLRKQFASAYEQHEDAQKYIAPLKQRIAALRHAIRKFGDLAIHIDLSEQMVSLIQDGEIVALYPVSSGKASTPTPTGKFQIHRKQTLRVSQQEIPYRMPNYMAFTPNQAYGMHALPYLGASASSSDFWQEALDHIGNPVSHGCVRLLPEDAAQLYSAIEVGTPLYISS